MLARRTSPQRLAAPTAKRTAPALPSAVSRLQRDVGNRGLHRLLQTGVIQAKLTVGPADDEYEREADRVADEVMRMPDPSGDVVQRAPVQIERMCPECEDELQRQPIVVRRASTLVQRKCPACEKAAHRPEEHAGATMQRSELDSEESDAEAPLQIRRMCRECDDELQRSPFAIRRQPTDFVFEDVAEDERLQAKAVTGQTPQVTPEMESQLADLQGQGSSFRHPSAHILSHVSVMTSARCGSTRTLGRTRWHAPFARAPLRSGRTSYSGKENTHLRHLRGGDCSHTS